MDSPEISEATGNLIMLSETTTIHHADFTHQKLILPDFLSKKTLKILWFLLPYLSGKTVLQGGYALRYVP